MTETKPIALCPTCAEPLISTFMFTGYEFLCICCGRRVTYIGPVRGDGDDPKVSARLAELQALWDENAGDKILPTSRFWRDGCERCHPPEGGLGEDHWQHVTDAERAADVQAREWIKGRVK